MKPLSYTQIALYQSCPLCYKLQYIDGLSPKEKWYFSFGETLHQCCQFFFRVKVPPPPSLPQLLAFYAKTWLPEGYDSAEEEDKYRAYGKEILTQFWQSHSENFAMPLAAEHMFYVDIEGVPLRGFIDRIDKLPSGGLAIIDYKSNKEMFTKDEVENNLQLTLYQLAVEKTWFLPVEKLTLYHLRSNTPCSAPARNRAQIEEAKKLVAATAEAIAGEKFPATENTHCPCDFPEHCPYYRHKYAPREGKKETLTPETIEHYVLLQTQIRDLERELEEIRNLITSYCQSQGLNRVFGKEHAITYNLTERTGFPEDEVRALLEPLGLWQKVLTFDQTRLRQLLADKELAQDIRRKLEGLRQITAQYPQLRVRRLKEEE